MELSKLFYLNVEFLRSYQDVFLYLTPSLVMAIAIKYLAQKSPIFLLLRLTGTVCHEFAHFFVGYFSGAQPATFSVIPRRTESGWTLGSVAFSNLRWFNAAPVAMAPFLILGIPFWVAVLRTHPGWSFDLGDLLIAALLGPQFISFWPSKTDWWIAVNSWPYLIIIWSVWYVINF